MQPQLFSYLYHVVPTRIPSEIFEVLPPCTAVTPISSWLAQAVSGACWVICSCANFSSMRVTHIQAVELLS